MYTETAEFWVDVYKGSVSVVERILFKKAIKEKLSKEEYEKFLTEIKE